MGSALDQFLEEGPRRLLARQTAQGVVGIDSLEVCVHRLEAVQRMPQKTPVENDCVRQNRFGVANMMARYRLHGRMISDEFRQVGIIQHRDIIGSMDGRKPSPKLSFKNGRNCTAPILEYMVVNDYEPRRRNRYPDIHSPSLFIERSQGKKVS